MELNIWNTSIMLVVFTFLFIAADEYIAKPIRRRRMEKDAETDPYVREALEIADRVRDHIEDQDTGASDDSSIQH